MSVPENSILETTPGLLNASLGEMTPKFLATRNAAGVPNVVPCISLLPASDRPNLVFFGNFLLRKTIRNLEEDPRLAIMIVTPQLEGWILKGQFLEFQNDGPYYETQMNSRLLRYNAYTGVRNAGLVRVISLENVFHISRLQVALDYFLAWASTSGRENGMDAHAIRVPGPVRKEFARMVAIKVLAWTGQDGYPRLTPALSLQPAGSSQFIARLQVPQLPQPENQERVAANVLTFEAISYQVKGRWQSSHSIGALFPQEIYAGGPPIPGGRIA